MLSVCYFVDLKETENNYLTEVKKQYLHLKGYMDNLFPGFQFSFKYLRACLTTDMAHTYLCNMNQNMSKKNKVTKFLFIINYKKLISLPKI